MERRLFVRSMASVAGVALVGCGSKEHAREGEHGKAEQGHGEGEGEVAVTPGEDLMQEHGVLERILLVYDEGARRIERSEALDASMIARAAGIVRRFVEDYHEQLEERFVFPRLDDADREKEIVAVLRRQHERGREITDRITRLSSGGASAELAGLMTGYARMYRPHAAREDTVVFRAFREVVGAPGYRELGEQFEEQEHERFGEGGFDGVVRDVAEIERALGIHDLARFTPA